MIGAFEISAPETLGYPSFFFANGFLVNQIIVQNNRTLDYQFCIYWTAMKAVYQAAEAVGQDAECHLDNLSCPRQTIVEYKLTCTEIGPIVRFHQVNTQTESVISNEMIVKSMLTSFYIVQWAH